MEILARKHENSVIRYLACKHSAAQMPGQCPRLSERRHPASEASRLALV